MGVIRSPLTSVLGAHPPSSSGKWRIWPRSLKRDNENSGGHCCCIPPNVLGVRCDFIKAKSHIVMPLRQLLTFNPPKKKNNNKTQHYLPLNKHGNEQRTLRNMSLLEQIGYPTLPGAGYIHLHAKVLQVANQIPWPRPNVIASIQSHSSSSDANPSHQRTTQGGRGP